MSSELVSEIEAQARRLRDQGNPPPGFEEDLDRAFEQAAEESLEESTPNATATVLERAGALPAGSELLARLRRRADASVRARMGPPLRRLQRMGKLRAARSAETAWLRVYVTMDHLERLAAQSALASRVLAAVRPRELAAEADQPALTAGPLLGWVLGRFDAVAARGIGGASPAVAHLECGEGRVVEALAAAGFDAQGADPRLSTRAAGETNVVAAGALEYLGSVPRGSLDGLLLTGVVDRLRPGAARSLAQLAARCLAPGGVLVLVSSRPETAVALDPVAADLSPGRALHPVTWCHLLARFGLVELEVFEPESTELDAAETDVFAVAARRRDAGLLDAGGQRQ